VVLRLAAWPGAPACGVLVLFDEVLSMSAWNALGRSIIRSLFVELIAIPVPVPPAANQQLDKGPTFAGPESRKMYPAPLMNIE
jgi:hypothetical protein